MKMKHALVGLMMGGLSAMIRDWPDAAPGIKPIAMTLLGNKQGAAWHKAFNGCQPSVKRAQRQAKAKRAGRRARRLGHA